MTGSRPLSARDAEVVLGIPAATVRSWYFRRARTGLHSMGIDARGHPLFYEADLLALRAGRRLRDEAGNRLDDSPESGTPG